MESGRRKERVGVVEGIEAGVSLGAGVGAACEVELHAASKPAVPTAATLRKARREKPFAFTILRGSLFFFIFLPKS